jgi:hypothetical protein
MRRTVTFLSSIHPFFLQERITGVIVQPEPAIAASSCLDLLRALVLQEPETVLALVQAKVRPRCVSPLLLL